MTDTVHTDESGAFDSRAEAAAALLAYHLRSAGNTDAVGRDGAVVAYSTHAEGHHLGNVHRSYDCEVHLAAEPAAIESGPLAGDIPDESTVYVNIQVHGLRLSDTDGWGYALPTHTPTPSGPDPRGAEHLPEPARSAARYLDLP